MAASPNIKELPRVLSERLKRFAQLPQNWDSYGAPPISGRVIDEARNVLKRACTSSGFDLPIPFVSPTPEGGIGMEWKLESGKELLLEISSDGSASYLLVVPRPDGEEEDREDDIRSTEDLDELFENIKG